MIPSNGNGKQPSAYEVRQAAYEKDLLERFNKKLNEFTPLFYSFQKAVMEEREIPLEWRVGDFLTRHSAGNHSIYVVGCDPNNKACGKCLDRKGKPMTGKPLTQSDIARSLDEDRRDISRVLINFKRFGFIEDDGVGLVFIPAPAKQEDLFAKPEPDHAADRRLWEEHFPEKATELAAAELSAEAARESIKPLLQAEKQLRLAMLADIRSLRAGESQAGESQDFVANVATKQPAETAEFVANVATKQPSGTARVASVADNRAATYATDHKEQVADSAGVTNSAAPLTSNRRVNSDMDHSPAAAEVPEKTPPPPVVRIPHSLLRQTTLAVQELAPAAGSDLPQQIFRTCRAIAPDCNDDDVAAAIREKMRANRPSSPSGFLLRCVPQMFDESGLWKEKSWCRVSQAHKNIELEDADLKKQQAEIAELQQYRADCLAKVKQILEADIQKYEPQIEELITTVFRRSHPDNLYRGRWRQMAIDHLADQQLSENAYLLPTFQEWRLSKQKALEEARSSRHKFAATP